MKKVVVLGGCGFIGSHVAEYLIQKKYNVIIIDNLSTGNIDNKPKEAKLYKINIGDSKKLEQIFKKEKPKIIFHCASSLVSVQESIGNPLKSFEDIVTTSNMFTIAMKYKVKKLIFSSSANIYSKDAELPIHENSLIKPLSPYGITKLSIESYCKYVQEIFGFKTVVLRYFNVFGPRQNIGKKEGIVPILISSVINNDKMYIANQGKQSRDFVYVKDVARANVIAAEKNITGTYNVGSGKSITIMQLIRTMEKISGKKIKVVKKYKYREIMHSLSDISKITYHLDWNPIVKFEDGLKETYEYYYNNTKK